MNRHAEPIDGKTKLAKLKIKKHNFTYVESVFMAASVHEMWPFMFIKHAPQNARRERRIWPGHAYT